MSIDDVKEHFIEVGPGKRFHFDPGMVDRAVEAAAERDRQPSTVPYTIDRERTMLKAFGRHVRDHLDRRASDIRSSHVLVFAEGAVDWVGEAMAESRIQAQVCRLLGLMGTSARVRPDARERLRIEGFSDAEIDRVDAAARRHASVEDERDWLIGPEREVLVYHLDSVGIALTAANVRRLRESALCLLANLLERTSDRYSVVPIHVSDIAADVLRDPDLPDFRARTAQTIRAGRPQARPKSEAFSPPVTVEKAQMLTPADDARPPASFIGLVAALARSKTNPKARSWEVKTARQHLSIAKLFAKVVGTDDPRRMTQAHVGAYVSLLAQLPTHWGKSADDADRSIEDIMARIEDLDDDEIGLAAPTINRHRTQLSTILAHLEENGYPIGVIGKKSMAKDTRSPDEKRRPFTVEDGRALIEGAMSNIGGRDSTPSSLCLKNTDAQFWVFPLAWYTLMRLGEACGLMVDDVDSVQKKIIIRDNKLRRVKNKTSQRTVAIHSELVRIGFLDFVLQQKALGHEALFPELHGSATAATVLFNKKWVQILDLALPGAREQRKTMHSTRKGGNGAMIAGKVMDSVRYYIMGHAPKDVHGRHYTPDPSYQEIVDALDQIPIITKNVTMIK